jgi:integrase
MKTGAAKKYPKTVKSGHASVRVYCGANRGVPIYSVTWLTKNNGRERRFFRDEAEALREAESIAGSLESGDFQALKLTGADRASFIEAERELRQSGVSILTAAHRYAEAIRILGRDEIIEAAKMYAARRDANLPEYTVADAVANYVDAKNHEGISPHYRRDIRQILTSGLAGAFRCRLTSVTSDNLRAYLNAKKGGPLWKDNHRRVIVAFFNFAKANGWLPKNESTAADALKPYHAPDRDVEIFAPREVARLLEHADSDFVPWIALIAFGGVRSEELRKGLGWDAIDFTKGTLIVPGRIAKTKRKRKLDIPDNLRAWLAPFRGRKGPIFRIKSAGRIEKACEASGIKWKRNALRHSFGSYRMEQVKNAGQVALEMGNSPAVVLKHYHEIVDASDAKAYWSISPTSSKNVIHIRGKAA